MLSECGPQQQAVIPSQEVSGEHLEDLLAALSPYGRWQGWLFVSMALRYYLDESESLSAEDPAVCVGGYIGAGKKWMRFISPWNAALDMAPKWVDVFHATDYERGHSSRWGVYHGWTPTEREMFIDRLIRIIRGHRFDEIGCVIHRSTFNQVMAARGTAAKHSDLFVVAAKVAMVNASAWAITHGHQYAPSFIVEEGAKYAKEMREALRQLKETKHPKFREFYRLSAVSEVPKSREHPQTQPADCLVYYCSKWAAQFSGLDPSKETITDFRTRTKAQMPSVLQRLISARNDVTYHTPETLDLLLTSLESDVSLADIDSIVYDAD